MTFIINQEFNRIQCIKLNTYTSINFYTYISNLGSSRYRQDMGNTCNNPNKIQPTNNNQIVNNHFQPEAQLKKPKLSQPSIRIEPQHHFSQQKKQKPIIINDVKNKKQQNKQKEGNQGGNLYKIFCCLNICNFTSTKDEDQIVNLQQVNKSKKKQMNQNQNHIQENKPKQKLYQSIICGGCQRNDKEDKQCQLMTSQRVFFRNSFQNPQKQQNQDPIYSYNQRGESQMSPRFQEIRNNLQTSQSNKDDEAEASTKKQSFQNNKKLIIRAKDSSILSEYYNKSKIKLNKLEIPFEIVKLSLSKTLIEGLSLYYPQFQQKFGSKYSPRSCNWRMLQNGTYTNILDNLHGVFIAKDLFYQGYFIQNSKTSFSPDQKGIVINKQFMYNGQFKLGKANGIGKLICRETKDVYQGTWYEGLLVIGSIQKQNIIFTGQFYNSQPYGHGELKVKNKKISYKGKFNKGAFDDEDAIYQCQKYIYKGGFRNGKKNGKGVLTHKVKNIQVQGYWANDQIKKPIITSTKQQF